MKKAVLIFRGDRGAPEKHLSKTVVRSITDLTTALAFANYMAANYLSTTVYKVSHTESFIEADAAAPGADANIDHRGVCLVQSRATGGTGKYRIPAVDPAAIDQSSDGDRLDKTLCEGFANLVGLATGLSFVSRGGYVEQVK